MQTIHPTAIISSSAEIGDACEIGPYCIVGDGVKLGSGCRLHSHVVIEGFTTIGKDNEFFPFAAIGGKSQDLKYAGEPTYLRIGERNVFRENVTIHRSTSSELLTQIGDDNLFLAYAHVAHECEVGNHTIFSNNGTIAGHVVVEDHAIISGLTAVHQFCRIGAHSITGGCSKIIKDIPPFMVADGNPASVRAINEVGLKRRGVDPAVLSALRVAYKKLFLRKGKNLSECLDELLATDAAKVPEVERLISFIKSSERGITR